jgi:hypothetical protein
MDYNPPSTDSLGLSALSPRQVAKMGHEAPLYVALTGKRRTPIVPAMNKTSCNRFFGICREIICA